MAGYSANYQTWLQRLGSATSTGEPASDAEIDAAQRISAQKTASDYGSLSAIQQGITPQPAPYQSYSGLAGLSMSRNLSGQPTAGLQVPGGTFDQNFDWQKNLGNTVPGLGGATVHDTSVPGISKLVGGKFGNVPMFTDNPTRAAAEYRPGGGALSVVPSTFAADKAQLSGLFQRYLNAGNLEGAQNTAMSPAEQGQAGALEQQRWQIADNASNTRIAGQVQQDRRQEEAGKIESHLNTVLQTMAGGSRRTQQALGPIVATLAALHHQVINGIGDPAISQPPQPNQLNELIGQQGKQQEFGMQQQIGAAQVGLAQVSAEQKRAELQNTLTLRDLGQKYQAETDPEKRAAVLDQINAMQGVAPREAVKVVKQGKVMDDMGNAIEQPELLYDVRNKNWIERPGLPGASSMPPSALSATGMSGPPPAMIARLKTLAADPKVRDRAIQQFERDWGAGSAAQFLK